MLGGNTSSRRDEIGPPKRSPWKVAVYKDPYAQVRKPLLWKQLEAGKVVGEASLFSPVLKRSVYWCLLEIQYWVRQTFDLTCSSPYTYSRKLVLSELHHYEFGTWTLSRYSVFLEFQSSRLWVSPVLPQCLQETGSLKYLSEQYTISCYL